MIIVNIYIVIKLVPLTIVVHGWRSDLFPFHFLLGLLQTSHPLIKGVYPACDCTAIIAAVYFLTLNLLHFTSWYSCCAG